MTRTLFRLAVLVKALDGGLQVLGAPAAARGNPSRFLRPGFVVGE
ncbi:hypothetical protein [Alloactinosynnema sp. L-07]|nr:hypothetical protein [Alloactinosynnema sp. L-07]